VRRKGQGGLLAAVGAIAFGVVLSGSPFACSSAEPLSAAGGPCALVTDCQDGLVCCNGKNGSLTCVGTVECLQPAGADGDAAMMPSQTDGAGGDGGHPADATQQENDTGSPMSEAEAPETGTTPEPDAGKPVDAGKPEDAGGHPEAATPPQDSGGDEVSD
jgi:hypothetical protein